MSKRLGHSSVKLVEIIIQFIFGNLLAVLTLYEGRNLGIGKFNVLEIVSLRPNKATTPIIFKMLPKLKCQGTLHSSFLIHAI